MAEDKSAALRDYMTPRDFQKRGEPQQWGVYPAPSAITLGK